MGMRVWIWRRMGVGSVEVMEAMARAAETVSLTLAKYSSMVWGVRDWRLWRWFMALVAKCRSVAERDRYSICWMISVMRALTV